MLILIHMEIHGAQNSQNSIEKTELSWIFDTSQFQNLLQSYNNQDTMVLVKGYENRSVG